MCLASLLSVVYISTCCFVCCVYLFSVVVYDEPTCLPRVHTAILYARVWASKCESQQLNCHKEREAPVTKRRQRHGSGHVIFAKDEPWQTKSCRTPASHKKATYFFSLHLVSIGLEDGICFSDSRTSLAVCRFTKACDIDQVSA